MPSFLPNLDELRGLASSLNLYNIFSDTHQVATLQRQPSLPHSRNITSLATSAPDADTSAGHHHDNLRSSRLDHSSISLSSDHVHTSRASVSVLHASKQDSAGDSVAGTQLKSKSRKLLLDTYCIVRPPSLSAKGQPNLQIQLIVKPSITTKSRSTPSRGNAGDPATDTAASQGTVSPLYPSATRRIPHTDHIQYPGDRDARLLGSVPADDGLSQAYAESEGSTLARSGSFRSEISAGSVLGSDSTSSAMGPGSARKRVEPLFNLAVHSVFPTVISDAVTDTRVAKFLKRGVDLVGVGTLQPTEVWIVSSTKTARSFRYSGEGYFSTGGSMPMPLPLVCQASSFTPATEAASRPASQSTGVRGVSLVRSEAGVRQFLGKLFKRKGVGRKPGLELMRVSAGEGVASSCGDPLTSTACLSSDVSGPRSDLSVIGHRSLDSGLKHLAVGPVAIGTPTFGTAPLVIRRAYRGDRPHGCDEDYAPLDLLQLHRPPSLASRMSTLESNGSSRPRSPDIARHPLISIEKPSMYLWTVKNWAKRSNEGRTSSRTTGVHLGLDFVSPTEVPDGGDDVVFEWIRIDGSNAPAARPATEIPDLHRPLTVGTQSSSEGNRSLVERSGQMEAVPKVNIEQLRRDGPLGQLSTPFGNQSPCHVALQTDGDRRMSVASQVRANAPDQQDDGDARSMASTEEEQVFRTSPEDDETPWSCFVTVQGTGVRQFLGTLSPEMHHPKVIGVLRMPAVVKGITYGDLITGAVVGGQSSSTSGGGSEFLPHQERRGQEDLRRDTALTEEHLKDVVCVTALWLVAREGFGGLGQKKRT